MTAICGNCGYEIFKNLGGVWVHRSTGGALCWVGSKAAATPKEVAKARTTDPETSHEAAGSVEDLTGKQDAVFRLLQIIGPATDQQIAGAYDDLWRSGDTERYPKQSVSGLRTRRSELVKKGKVKDTGERARLPSGRQAIVWQAVE